jgi:hypothetical protein
VPPLGSYQPVSPRGQVDAQGGQARRRGSFIPALAHKVARRCLPRAAGTGRIGVPPNRGFSLEPLRHKGGANSCTLWITPVLGVVMGMGWAPACVLLQAHAGCTNAQGEGAMGTGRGPWAPGGGHGHREGAMVPMSDAAWEGVLLQAGVTPRPCSPPRVVRWCSICRRWACWQVRWCTDARNSDSRSGWSQIGAGTSSTERNRKVT